MPSAVSSVGLRVTTGSMIWPSARLLRMLKDAEQPVSVKRKARARPDLISKISESAERIRSARGLGRRRGRRFHGQFFGLFHALFNQFVRLSDLAGNRFGHVFADADKAQFLVV